MQTPLAHDAGARASEYATTAAYRFLELTALRPECRNSAASAALFAGKRRLRRLRNAARRTRHRSNSATGSLTSCADSSNVFAMNILAANGAARPRALVASGGRRDDSLERGLDAAGRALAVTHDPPSLPTCNSASAPPTPATVPRHQSVDLHVSVRATSHD